MMPPFKIYYRAIEPEGGSRAAREEAAVAAMVAKAFGPGARRVHDALGAPYILKADGSRLGECISISHSRRTAALAVCAATIGIDIEEERSQLSRVAPRVLSDDEFKVYSQQPHGLLRAWTLKEALFKASRARCGGEIDFTRQLHLPLGKEAEARVFGADGRLVGKYSILTELRPDGQMLAVAICRDDDARSR